MQMVDDSPEYYRLRESEERMMAETAKSGDVRAIHLTLADKYRELAEKAEKRA